MPFVKRERTYYKDGVEVPADTITDFGRTTYYKNIVTTKYWKEITTGSRELEYACYTGLVMGGNATATYYVKYPLGTDDYLYNANKEIVTNTQSSWNQYLVSVTETTLVVVYWGITYSLSRSSDGDLYKDTTVTETVEGTPEDYTYTTEEVTTIEVTADDDYDYSEFVPSTQFDYHIDRNKLYQLAAVKRSYYKYADESTLINADGVVTSATGGNGWKIYEQANYEEVYLMLNATANTAYPRWQTGSPNVYAYFKTPKKGIVTSYLTTQWTDENGRYPQRCCNHWIITGYETESDMLALVNGVIIDDNTWASWQGQGTSKTVTLDNNKAFQYYTIHMVSNFANGSYCSMGNTKFYTREPVEATSSDYDYYKDNLVSYTPIVRNPRKYYKYIYGAWTRPNLSSDGTLGGSSFAVSRTGGGGTTMTGSTYASMDGNTGTSCKFAYSSNDSTYTFYNPKPLLLSSLSFTYYDGNIGYGIKSGSLQASNDNSSWETLATFTSNLSTWQINATKHYKYFKINIADGYDVMLTEIYVNAKQLVETVESTSDDYSYYVDSVKLY